MPIIEAQDQILCALRSQGQLKTFRRSDWREAFLGVDRHLAQTVLLSLWREAGELPLEEQLGLLKAAHSVLPLKDQPLRHLACRLAGLSLTGSKEAEVGSVELEWVDVLLDVMAAEARYPVHTRLFYALLDAVENSLIHAEHGSQTLPGTKVKVDSLRRELELLCTG